MEPVGTLYLWRSLTSQNPRKEWSYYRPERRVADDSPPRWIGCPVERYKQHRLTPLACHLWLHPGVLQWLAAENITVRESGMNVRVRACVRVSELQTWLPRWTQQQQLWDITHVNTRPGPCCLPLYGVGVWLGVDLASPHILLAWGSISEWCNLLAGNVYHHARQTLQFLQV